MVRYLLHVYISYYLINNYWLAHIKIFKNVFHIFQARASTRASTRLQLNRKDFKASVLLVCVRSMEQYSGDVGTAWLPVALRR